MSEFSVLLQILEKFRDDRDWAQFHDSKNLALALSIEAAELNELFLWKKEEEAEQVDKQRLRAELADVFAYAIMLTGFVFPIVCHSVWSVHGFLNPFRKNPLFESGMVDIAGMPIILLSILAFWRIP